MTIYGDEPLKNENASDCFGVVAILIEERINEWFEQNQDRGMSEPGVVGFVVALRLLVQAEPMNCSVSLRASLVEKWKQQYAEWIDKFGSKVRVKRGVDRDLMWQKALGEFDLILKALKEGS